MDNLFTTPGSLADDPSFRQYVRQTDTGAVQKWTEWLARHPNQADLVAEATQLVSLLDTYQARQLTQADIGHEITRLKARLGQSVTAQPKVRRPNPVRQIEWWHAAAASLLLVAGLWWYQSRQLILRPVPSVTDKPPQTLAAQPDSPLLAQTDYGQRRTVRLPDGSTVTLNAHSTLELSPDWASGNREVRLYGQAFFRVSKQKRAGQPVKFVVRAGNVAVEVLGTQFDVSTRNRRVKVVLNEGKIRLNVAGNPQTGIVSRTLDMLPGDLVEVTDRQDVTLDSHVPTAEHVAWVNDELVFDDTPLSDVATTIENNYGYRVEFADPNLASQRLTATLPDPSLDVLLKALEKVFNLTVTTQRKTIRLAKA